MTEPKHIASYLPQCKHCKQLLVIKPSKRAYCVECTPALIGPSIFVAAFEIEMPAVDFDEAQGGTGEPFYTGWIHWAEHRGAHPTYCRATHPLRAGAYDALRSAWTAKVQAYVDQLHPAQPLFATTTAPRILRHPAKTNPLDEMPPVSLENLAAKVLGKPWATSVIPFQCEPPPTETWAQMHARVAPLLSFGAGAPVRENTGREPFMRRRPPSTLALTLGMFAEDYPSACATFVLAVCSRRSHGLGSPGAMFRKKLTARLLEYLACIPEPGEPGFVPAVATLARIYPSNMETLVDLAVRSMRTADRNTLRDAITQIRRVGSWDRASRKQWFTAAFNGAIGPWDSSPPSTTAMRAMAVPEAIEKMSREHLAWRANRVSAKRV